MKFIPICFAWNLPENQILIYTPTQPSIQFSSYQRLYKKVEKKAHTHTRFCHLSGWMNFHIIFNVNMTLLFGYLMNCHIDIKLTHWIKMCVGPEFYCTVYGWKPFSMLPNVQYVFHSDTRISKHGHIHIWIFNSWFCSKHFNVNPYRDHSRDHFDNSV